MDTHFEKLRKEADVYYHKAQRELRIFRNTGCLTDKTKSKIADSYKEDVMCDFFSSMAIPRLSYLYHQTDRADHGGITIMYKVEDFVITIYCSTMVCLVGRVSPRR